MSETITLWFDYISPYAWLAHRRLRTFADAHGLEVELRPMLFAACLDQAFRSGMSWLSSREIVSLIISLRFLRRLSSS